MEELSAIWNTLTHWGGAKQPPHETLEYRTHRGDDEAIPDHRPEVLPHRVEGYGHHQDETGAGPPDAELPVYRTHREPMWEHFAE